MATNQQIADIINSCRRGPIETIRSQIDAAIVNDEDFVNKLNADSWSPLHVAAQKGRLSLVNLLLEFGLDPDTRDHGTGIPGYTPLYDAIFHRNYEVAMRLCEVTSDWKHSRIGCWGRSRELTPAEISKYEKLICKMIDSGWDINSVDFYGRNALMNTFSSGTYALMPILIKMGIDVDFKNAAGRTCLSVAVRSRRPLYEACQLLIDSGANVNTVDDRGDTVLMSAVASGNLQIAALLVSSGARVNHQKDVRGEIVTPLSISIHLRYYDLARYLVENGANIEINLTGDQTILGLLYDVRTFQTVVELMYEKYGDLVDDEFDEVDNLNYAHTLEEAGKKVEDMEIDESTKIMMLTLCREAKAPKGASELLKFVEIFQKQKNLDGLLKSDKVKEMQIPINILQMIASPLKWH